MKAILKFGCPLLVVALFTGCQAWAPWQAADINSMTKTVAQFNRGAALLEQYSYVKAAEAFERVVEDIFRTPGKPLRRCYIQITTTFMHGSVLGFTTSTLARTRRR